MIVRFKSVLGKFDEIWSVFKVYSCDSFLESIIFLAF